MRLFNRCLVEDLQGVVEVVRLIVEGNSEIIAKGIHNDHNGFIKSFRMPASFFKRIKVMIRKADWRHGAF